MKQVWWSIFIVAMAVAAKDSLAATVAQQQEGVQFLQRVAVAAQQVSFTGTFVYRSGTLTETSRIIHSLDNGSSVERIAVLDGAPREIVRNNNEVRCYLPEERLVIVEPRSQHRSFPALLPVSLAGLSEFYTVRKAGLARMAGLESQIVRIEPRDSMRYGHQYWVDIASGLLLKAEIFDERSNVLESIAFTDLRIGGSAEKEPLQSLPDDKKQVGQTWQVKQVRLSDIRESVPWQFRTELPGFRKQMSLRRVSPQEGGDIQERLQWLYSDGLSAYSIFITPPRPQKEFVEGVETIGALSIARRRVNGWEVVVMGDLPLEAIRRVAEGIDGRRK